MKIHYFDTYQREFDEKAILKSMGMPQNHIFGKDIAAMLEKTDKIAKPKGLFAECSVDEITDKTVTIEGYTFRSSILGQRIGDNKIVYPSLGTCGRELAEYADTLTNQVEKLAIDSVMLHYLLQMDAKIAGEIENLLPDGRVLSGSNPGSLYGWGTKELHVLFDLLGEYAEKTGVEVRDSHIMYPVKSLCGIRFGTEELTHDCALCQRKKCPNRRAAFNMKALLEATGKSAMDM